MSNEDTLRSLGKLIPEAMSAQRDAVHVAVMPIEAGEPLLPGGMVKIKEGLAYPADLDTTLGVVDPFLQASVRTGEQFWLFLNPGSITSLRHEWTHPQIDGQNACSNERLISKSWMEAWACAHVGYDYYEGGERTPTSAYESAIIIGHTHNLGPYEDARDHIDDTWWKHWEVLTGVRGERDVYFRCAC